MLRVNECCSSRTCNEIGKSQRRKKHECSAINAVSCMEIACHARQCDIMFCTIMSRSSFSIIAKKEMMLQDGQGET